MKSKKNSNLTKVLFIIYFALLIWIILFKCSSPFSLDHHRSINLIPFIGSMIINGKLHVSEIIENVLIFVPFGIYIYMLRSKWSFVKMVIPIFCTSLAFEILQYIFAIGATDITDLIGNTLGGILGIGVYIILVKLFKEKTNKIINVLATIASVLAVFGLGFMTFCS